MYLSYDNRIGNKIICSTTLIIQRIQTGEKKDSVAIKTGQSSSFILRRNYIESGMEKLALTVTRPNDGSEDINYQLYTIFW